MGEVVKTQLKNFDIINFIIEEVPLDIDKTIDQALLYVRENQGKSLDVIASNYADNIIRQYTAVGVATALPGVLPGGGTLLQLIVETSGISVDLLLMLKYMKKMVFGLSAIYGFERNSITIETMLCVFGVWCGVLSTAKEALLRVGTKVLINFFNRTISKEIFKKVNQKIGVTIITKYGSKRAGAFLGKLIPFGVGTLVGGGFNYLTMSGFKKAAINTLKDKGEGIVFVETEG